MSDELDAEDEDEELSGPAAGQRNLITPDGHNRLIEERRYLLREERPKVVETVAWAAGNGDRSENGDYLYGKRRLREIDRRVRWLTRRIEAAEVVDPRRQTRRDQVFFGATVVYCQIDAAVVEGDRRQVTIVGTDETDSDQGRISWVSPVARALMRAAAGDVVRLATPKGVEQVKVLEISYPA